MRYGSRSTFSIALTITVLFQSVFISSGLFGTYLLENKKLCTCNHNSPNEVHAKLEDRIFAQDKLAISLYSTDHSSEHSEHDHNAIQETSPNCHSAKIGEAHICSCKKQESASYSLIPHLQFFYAVPYRWMDPELKTIALIPSIDSELLHGTQHSLFKPPKNS
jgi:hypothetical protein